MTSLTSKSKKTVRAKPYIVYVLACKDGSLYTGITNDLKRRIAEHSTGKRGARYTRSRRPVLLAYAETCRTKSAALKREAAIKDLPRAKKLLLLKSRDLRRIVSTYS